MAKGRYSEYTGKPRKRQIEVAHYGPKTLENPTFQWVLDCYLSYGGVRLPRQNRLKMSRKNDGNYLQEILEKSLKFPLKSERDCGEVFRKIADAVEAIRKVHLEKIYHDGTAVKLLEATKQIVGPEHYWPSDRYPSSKDFVEENCPAHGDPHDYARKVRALCKALGISLTRGARGKDQRPRTRVKNRAKKK